MMQKIEDFVMSSEGQGLSMRLKSLLVGLSSIAVLLGPAVGLDLTPESWGEGADIAEKIVGALVLAASGFFQFKGWVRARFNKENKLGRFAGR